MINNIMITFYKQMSKDIRYKDKFCLTFLSFNE